MKKALQAPDWRTSTEILWAWNDHSFIALAIKKYLKKLKNKKDTEKKLKHLKVKTLEIPETTGKEGKNSSVYIWK